MLMNQLSAEIQGKITEPWNKLTLTYKYFRVKGLIILTHNNKDVWKYTECQDIRQSHLSMKLGHNDPEIL